MASTTVDTTKKADQSKPKKHFSIVGVVVSLVVVLILIGAISYWYFGVYKPNNYYNAAIKQAQAQLQNGNSQGYHAAATTLTGQISRFRTSGQKEQGYRTLAQLEDGQGNSPAAFTAYMQAEAIKKSTNMGEILRIARLAQTEADNQVAVAYYQRALTMYDANKAAYSQYPQAFIDSLRTVVTNLQKGSQ